MTRRRPTKRQRRVEAAKSIYLALDEAAGEYEAVAKENRARATQALWAWIRMLEPLAARALKGK